MQTWAGAGRSEAPASLWRSVLLLHLSRRLPQTSSAVPASCYAAMAGAGRLHPSPDAAGCWCLPVGVRRRRLPLLLLSLWLLLGAAAAIQGEDLHACKEVTGQGGGILCQGEGGGHLCRADRDPVMETSTNKAIEMSLPAEGYLLIKLHPKLKSGVLVVQKTLWSSLV